MDMTILGAKAKLAQGQIKQADLSTAMMLAGGAGLGALGSYGLYRFLKNKPPKLTPAPTLPDMTMPEEMPIQRPQSLREHFRSAVSKRVGGVAGGMLGRFHQTYGA